MSNLIRLPIVVPNYSASLETRNKFARIAHGSVAVAIHREIEILGYPEIEIWIYFEGDIYGRHNRLPTSEERRQYAIIAAGRAIDNYPTIAKFRIDDEDELTEIGFVLYDQVNRSFIPRFFESEGLSYRNNS